MMEDMLYLFSGPDKVLPLESQLRGVYMSTEEEIKELKDEERQALNKRLESVGWAMFLIMIGGLALIPDESVPEGMWLIGTGLIMIGLNLARFLNGIKISKLTIILGFLALGTGLGDYLGLDIPVFAIMLILIGTGMIIRPLVERN
jgi:hypothetical protein